MRWLNSVLILYAVIMMIMGVHGKISANSNESLAGVVIGLLILGSVALSFTHPRPARIGAAAICLLVLGNFAPKFFKTGDWYPAGLSTILTFIVLGCLIVGHFMGMLARRERGRETLPDAHAERQAREREESAAHRSEPNS